MSQVPVPSELFAEYRIESVLGEGGMGVVYKAMEPYSGDVVAIKCLLARHASKDDFARRFKQECRLLARLRHANIVRMRRAGVTPENVPFIVMDLLEGNTLRKVLLQFQRLGRAMDLLPALHIMIQVADAMAFAHGKGILHRDLKPENIFIGSKGKERGHAWLLDFGIAKMERGGMSTDELPAVGTLAYLAPEQARAILWPAKAGEHAKGDARSDIYSFGVILYEVLGGRHPFFEADDARSTDEILAGQLSALPLPLHALLESCPAGLWEVVLRCLAKDPGARYQHFDEVVADLRRELHALVHTRPAEPMVVQKLAEEDAEVARLSAFRAVPFDDDIERTESPRAGPRSILFRTEELVNFVPSASPLPFTQPQSDATYVPVPSLRGKGHTVRLSRSPAVDAAQSTAAREAARLPATSSLPLATSKRAPLVTTLSAGRAHASVRAPPPPTTARITPAPMSATPVLMSRAPRPSPPLSLMMACCFGLGLLLSVAVLVLVVRARPVSAAREAPSIGTAIAGVISTAIARAGPPAAEATSPTTPSASEEMTDARPSSKQKSSPLPLNSAKARSPVIAVLKPALPTRLAPAERLKRVAAPRPAAAPGSAVTSGPAAPPARLLLFE